jgi:GR25 family glycosyltransferase involved in LPS biosynthesis
MELYVINVASATQRKENMEKRLKYHRLDVHAKFIDAITPRSEVARQFLSGYDGAQTAGEVCCFLSHVKALSEFVITDSSDPGVLIFEDDQLLHNNFVTELNEIMSIMAPNTNVVMLNRYNSSFDGCYIVNDKLMTIGSGTFSTGCYWISRSYAKSVVEKYGFSYNSDVFPDKFVTSEIITMKSGGVAARRLLAIGECLDSSLFGDPRVNEHLKYYKQHEPKIFFNADIFMNIAGTCEAFQISRQLD